MVLQLKPNFDTSGSHPVGQVSGTPTWYSENLGSFTALINDYSKWWSSNDKDFLYSVVGNTGFIQYGTNRSDFASARFTWEKVTWTNEHVYDDGYCSANVHVELGFLGGHKTSMSAAGYLVTNSLVFNGHTVASHSGNTIDNYVTTPNPRTFDFTVNIPPQQYSMNMNLEYRSHYPNGEVADANLLIGFKLYNPTPPVYIPMAARKSGSWKSLNANNGHILIRKSGSWVNKSKENFNTQRHENAGHNRIRRGGKWLQLPKM